MGGFGNGNGNGKGLQDRITRTSTDRTVSLPGLRGTLGHEEATWIRGGGSRGSEGERREEGEGRSGGAGCSAGFAGDGETVAGQSRAFDARIVYAGGGVGRRRRIGTAGKENRTRSIQRRQKNVYKNRNCRS